MNSLLGIKPSVGLDKDEVGGPAIVDPGRTLPSSVCELVQVWFWT